MMKIAMFVWEFYPRLVGGLGTYAVEMAREFIELGHDVSVFTLNVKDKPLKTYEIWKGIEIHRPMIVDLSMAFPAILIDDLKKWGTGLRFFCDIFSYNLFSAGKFLNALIRKEGREFDIVCVHDWLSAIAGLIVKSELKELPIAFHIHSTEEQRSGGGGSEVVKHFERSMAKEADVIVTVSYCMKKHLSNLGYPTEKIMVCWNGCDPEKYDPRKVDMSELEKFKEKHGIKPGDRVITFVGRLTWVKGVYNLIRALPHVLKEFPNAKLLVLGKGEAYSDLVELSKRLGIEDKVSFISEWVSEEERILFYSSADVCVFPSISEPFGIVSLEAMSMEKPVVVGAGELSGFMEQVIASGPDQCGVYVDGRDPISIAEGIKEVLRDPERAEKWGKKGREVVLTRFTWRKAALNTLSIYESLLRKS